jgi:hypothetical protein
MNAITNILNIPSDDDEDIFCGDQPIDTIW